MRKLAFLSVFALFCVFSLNAYAACELITSCSGANEYLTIPGMAGCYECDKDRCPNGTVISATTATLEGETYTNSMFTCHTESGGDLWRRASVPECTKPRYIALKNDVNAHRVMINPNTASVINNSGGAIAVVGVEACMGYVCDTGYTEKNGTCVKPNPKCATTTSSGSRFIGDVVPSRAGCTAGVMDTPLASAEHLATGAVCDATCAANGWNITLRDNSCAAGYEPDSAKKKCVETQASRDNRARRDRQRRENATKQEKCQDSGGTWAGSRCTCDSTKGLKKQGDECVCLDDTYERAPDGKSCKLTDIEAKKQACESAAGAYWDNDANRCRCEDEDSIWRGGRCVENTAKKRCKAASGTKWDASAEECVCKDSNYEYDTDSNECVETDEARTKREAAAEAARKQAEQDASKARITSITGKLNNLKSGLSVSVWKNKEGNFNTSRLVSDSVAGVVLGTAGGLITSNVIKKNQVKGGFEDIKCTIRGQVVADYGDDFQVGIQ